MKKPDLNVRPDFKKVRLLFYEFDPAVVGYGEVGGADDKITHRCVKTI